MAAFASEVSRAIGLVAAGTLCVAGVSKLARPVQAAAALRSLGVPAEVAAVRGLTTIEIAVGVGYLFAPARASLALVAVMFAFFTALVAYTLAAKTEDTLCGCFGGTESRYSKTHLVFNSIVAAVLATSVLFGGPIGLAALPAAQAVAYVGCLLLACYAVRMLLTDFGALAGLTKTSSSPARRRESEPR